MKESFFRQLEDGSIDFGNGVIGPSDADIERADEVCEAFLVSGIDSLAQDPNHSSGAETGSNFLAKTISSFLDRLDPRVKIGLQTGTAALALAFVAACSSSEKHEKPTPTPTRTSTPTPARLSAAGFANENLALPFPNSEHWYYVGGPHSDALSHGVRYAIDLAPDEVVNCPAPPILDRHVTAAAGGEVIVSGNENDPTDPNYSTIIIKLPSGLKTGYIHVANIAVHVGERVVAGELLGNPSCKYPPGGGAEGAHLHFFVFDSDGRPIPIKDFKLSNWTIHESPGDAQGTMTKSGLSVRTADRGRCGPDEASIRRCGGIRNDLSEHNLQPATPTPTPANLRQMSLVLDGIGDGVKIADSPSLHLSNGVTIEARIKLASGFIDTDGGDTVLAKGENSEPYVLWASLFKCPNREAAAFFNSGDWVCAGRKIPQGQWVNIAVTFDKQTAIMYIDGAQVATKDLPGGLTQNTEPLFIGQSPVPGDEDFAGEIDFEALWNKVRTPDEINGDFRGIGSVAQAQEDGLVGDWQFNGDFLDSTSNHNDGVPLGDAHLVED